MASNLKIKYFPTKARFNTEKSAGRIVAGDLCFINDINAIWTHGKYYSTGLVADSDTLSSDLVNYVKVVDSYPATLENNVLYLKKGSEGNGLSINIAVADYQDIKQNTYTEDNMTVASAAAVQRLISELDNSSVDYSTTYHPYQGSTALSISANALNGVTAITANAGTVLKINATAGASFSHNLRAASVNATGGTITASTGDFINVDTNTLSAHTSIECDGDISATNGFYETSDERLKNFVGDVEVDFNALKSIPKKHFTWKYDKSDTQIIGTSAQELQKVYPELVQERNGSLSVDYAKLSVICLKAIDELNERLSKLENND